MEKFNNLSFETKYIEDLKIDNFFDFVMLIDIFEHIEDIKTFIDQVAHLQTTGGVVYIVTPNPLYCGPAVEGEIYYKRSKTVTIDIISHMKSLSLCLLQAMGSFVKGMRKGLCVIKLDKS